MTAANPNDTFSATLVAALARLRVSRVVITPGSRNTPLAVAFAQHPAMTTSVLLDERSGAFFALGAARAGGGPAVIVTTSGTAAAELHPALVEARQALVPLIAITADRPSELRNTGAPQTIDQSGLFGPTVPLSIDLGAPPATADFMASVPALARRLVAAANTHGPVHLNVGFRDPLTPAPAAAIAEVGREHAGATGRPANVGEAPPGTLQAPLVVVGSSLEAEAVGAVLDLAETWRSPVIADAASGLRFGAASQMVLSSGDLLTATGWAGARRPDLIVRLGGVPTARSTWEWAQASDAPQLVVGRGRADPLGVAWSHVSGATGDVAAALAEWQVRGSEEWGQEWLAADRTAHAAAAGAIDAMSFPTEPGVARQVLEGVPAGSVVWVASSMPIRDANAFGGARPDISVMANRGANGIDGVISTALGHGAETEAPTYALVGDLAALHDLGGLVAAARDGADVTVVAVNNDGGGIFHFLPQREHPLFERLLGTPHGRDLAAIATGIGLTAEDLTDRAGLVDRISAAPVGPALLQVRTDRTTNVSVHETIVETVRAALSSGHR